MPRLAILADLAGLQSQNGSAEEPISIEPRTLPVLGGGLDLIADAIATAPRSPFLNDLALSRAAKALVEANRALGERDRPSSTNTNLLVEVTFRDAAAAIRGRDYRRAYALLDELPRKLRLN